MHTLTIEFTKEQSQISRSTAVADAIRKARERSDGQLFKIGNMNCVQYGKRTWRGKYAGTNDLLKCDALEIEYQLL